MHLQKLDFLKYGFLQFWLSFYRPYLCATISCESNHSKIWNSTTNICDIGCTHIMYIHTYMWYGNKCGVYTHMWVIDFNESKWMKVTHECAYTRVIDTCHLSHTPRRGMLHCRHRETILLNWHVKCCFSPTWHTWYKHVNFEKEDSDSSCPLNRSRWSVQLDILPSDTWEVM